MLRLAETRHHQTVATKVDRATSAFGRFDPHVAAATADLEAARAALAAARQQLDETRVNATFDAVVIADYVHPGSWINAGDVLYRIAASDFLDVSVEVSESHWQRLQGLTRRDINIYVLSPEGAKWSATVRFISPEMDPVTRQRRLMLQIENPFSGATPLLANQQVQVIFEGEALTDVAKAPASVLTEDGKVWSVVDQRLVLEEVEVLHERADVVLYRYRDRPDQQRRIVQFPLSTLLEGQLVARR